MTGKTRSKGISLANAFATAGPSIVQSAGATMPAHAQHVADIGEIARNPLNKRRIDPKSADIIQLAQSLKVDGQLSGIPVVPRADFLSWEGFDRWAKQIGPSKYVCIGGGRRRVAAGLAGLARMDIAVKTDLNAAAFVRLMVVENLERKDLTPLEEAMQIQTLREATGDSYSELGRQLNGRTKGWVGQRLDLLKLSPELQELLDSGEPGSMTVTQARLLLKRMREEVGDADDVALPPERQLQLWLELRDGTAAADRLPRKRSADAEPASPPPQANPAPAPAEPVTVPEPEPVAVAAGGNAPAPAFSSPEPTAASIAPPGSVTPPSFSASDAPAPKPRRAEAEDEVQPAEMDAVVESEDAEDPWDEMDWSTVDPANYALHLQNRMPAQLWAAFVREVNALAG